MSEAKTFSLRNLSVGERLAAVFSAAWIVVAASLYLSTIDSVLIYSYDRWVGRWYAWNPLAKLVPLFENGEVPDVPQFDLLGFLFFLLFPCAIIWALYFATRFVMAGTKR